MFLTGAFLADLLQGPLSLLYSLATNLADKWAFGKKRMTLPDQIYAYQKELIQELADTGSCVIVGRCADYILRNHPDCFHVFVYGDLENRKNRIISEHGIAAGMPKNISQTGIRNAASITITIPVGCGGWWKIMIFFYRSLRQKPLPSA